MARAKPKGNTKNPVTVAVDAPAGEEIKITSRDIHVKKGETVGDNECIVIVSGKEMKILNEMAARLHEKGYTPINDATTIKTDFGIGVEYQIEMPLTKFKIDYKDCQMVGITPRQKSTLKVAQDALKDVTKAEAKIQRIKDAMIEAQKELIAAKNEAKKFGDTIGKEMRKTAELAALRAKELAEKAAKKAEEAAKLAAEFTFDDEPEELEDTDPDEPDGPGTTDEGDEPDPEEDLDNNTDIEDEWPGEDA